MKTQILTLIIAATVLLSCNSNKSGNEEKTLTDTTKTQTGIDMQAKVNQYVKVDLTTDTSKLSESDKKVIPILIKVAKIMDDIYWKDAFAENKDEFLNKLSDLEKQYALINYGPWDRLDDNKPFIKGYGEKPKGANYYPVDMTDEEFNAFNDTNKTSWYTLIRRQDNGKLKVVWYHQAYKEQIEEAAKLIKQAAELADDEGFKKYLNLRAQALLTDNYLPSDLAWMDMKTNTLDFVVGPIENYEDARYGYKAAHSAQILVKDKEWSNRLNKFATLLPEMQKSLPCDEKYKQEPANSNADLNAYDVIYYAGDANAGSKNIAINLPNDPRVHVQKGSRKLQLKNVMKAKFDNMVVPISNILIDSTQRKNISFKAFFENTMFHEVAHGLGIKYVVGTNGKTKVRDALKETYSKLEEGKADILGLFLITKLHERGEFSDEDLMDNYVTFMASIFRSIRFGAASSHGIANMIRFNFFLEKGAFTKNPETGTYKVNFEKMKEASNELGALILKIQGDGDYQAAKKLVDEKGNINDDLAKDLKRIEDANIPVDIIFNQGTQVLGL